MFYNDLKRFGSSVALKYYSPKSNDLIQISYKELDQKISQFANPISAQNKSLILINVDNSLESFVALYGTLRAGHTAILADDKNIVLQNQLLEQYDVDFHFKKTKNKWQICSVNNKGCTKSPINNELAILLSTSGSTGSPKCVKLSYENIESNTKSICDYLPIVPTHTCALILPGHYSYGLSVINTHLFTGASVFIGELSVTQPEFLNYMQLEKINSLAGVPYTFTLMEMIKFRDVKLPHLEYITQAGGRLKPDMVALYNDWAKLHEIEFYVMYGQTEATARIAYVPPSDLDKYSHCIGIPIPGGQLQIWDDNDEMITTCDEPGELVYSGPNVMMGYANARADLSSEKRIFWLKTGDIACRNSDGLFYIVGRKKRFAKLYGKRFNLDDVEKYLDALGEISICTSDDDFLYVASEKSVNIENISKVSDHFGFLKKHVICYKVNKFPILSSGKYDYQSLLKLGQQQKHVTTTYDRIEGTIKDNILELYREALKDDLISSKYSFVELGGDSLTYVNVSLGLEQLLGYLPHEWERKTITELADCDRKDFRKGKFNFLIFIEHSIFFRALAIIAVVCAHSGTKLFAGGGAVLLFIAGYNFNRFQLDNILQKSFSRPIKSIGLYIMLPYWGLLVVYCFYKGGNFDYSHVFLYSNYIAYGWKNVPFAPWFIQVLIQGILLISLPTFIKSIRHCAIEKRLAYIGLFLCFACLIRIIDQLLYGYRIELQGMQTSWVIWIFFLGMLVNEYFNRNNQRIPTLVAITLIVIFYFNYFTWSPQGYALILVVLTMIWVPSIKIPILFSKPIQFISSSSLFIYLLHSFAPNLSLTNTWFIDIAKVSIGIFIGIIFWYAYNRSISFLQKRVDWVKLAYTQGVRKFFA